MNRLSILAVVGLIAFLSACGGGTNPGKALSPASCSIALRYADGGTSGLSMSQQSPTAAAVDVTSNSCNLSKLASVVLTVCVQHPELSELTGELRLSGTSLTQFRVTDGEEIGRACLVHSNGVSLRRFTLNNPDLSGLAELSGPWSVVIRDTQSNNLNGTFIAWGLELEGLQ